MAALHMIQIPKLEPRIMRYELTFCRGCDRDQCCLLIVHMTRTGSEPLSTNRVLGQTFLPEAIGESRSASAHTSITPETSSSDSSTRSSNVGESRRAMTSSPRTTSHSSNSRQ